MAAIAPLPPHHAAWLAAHPYRSEEWLRAALADGFDVHHVDGNHSNDDARNLVLIERTDHARLHGAGVVPRAYKRTLSPERLEIGRKVYEAKTPDRSWRRAANIAGMQLDRYTSASSAKYLADAYARANGLPVIVHCPVKNNAPLEPWA